MCGGLILASTQTITTIALYHTGRLLGYMGLGYFSGYLGLSLTHMSWVPTMMGLSFITIGIVSLFKKPDMTIPIFSTLLNWIVSLRSKLSATLYAFIIGLGSIFLPCGWLYTFVLSVSQTKNPVAGAGFLALFWLGTLPALTISPYLIKRYLGSLNHSISALIYVLVGIVTLIYRY